MDLPRLMIAGTGSGAGKTTITLGIMAALRKQGYRVMPYKAGPDYIDPGFHTLATGNGSRNLDLWLLSEETVLHLVRKHSTGMDLSIVEGVMGLYDGRGTDLALSSAHLAKVLRTPVVLVLNGSGMAASAAAMVLGYKQYDPEVNLCGVIINQVGSEGHYQLLKEAIERDTGVCCYGYLRTKEQFRLKSRYLGLVPGIESRDWQEKIGELVRETESSIDLQGLAALSKTAPDLHGFPVLIGVERVKAALRSQAPKHQADFTNATDTSRLSECSRKAVTPFLRIGVAFDEAFHFYYQDNLDLLRELGADVVRFSPLHDQELPADLDGLYIGGGFPEVFAEQLESNGLMRQSIADAVSQGIPTYAECGGMMYLTEAIVMQDQHSYQMAGVIRAKSVMTSQLQRFGYVEVEHGDNLFGLPGTIVPAHEFHYSTLAGEDGIEYGYRIRKRKADWECGVRGTALLAGYPHFHFYSNPKMAYGFLQKCWEYHCKRGR